MYERVIGVSGDSLRPSNNKFLLKGGFIESALLPSGVDDAAALRDSIKLAKNAVYERVSGGVGGSASRPDSKFFAVQKTCIKHIRRHLSMEHLSFVSIFVIALVASLGHCVGMCGGLVVAYTHAKLHNPRALLRNALSHLLYICGRVCAYMALGAVFGGFGAVFAQNMHTKAIMGVGVGALLLIFGFAYLLFPNVLRIFEPSLSPHTPQDSHSAKDAQSTHRQSLPKRAFAAIFGLFAYLLRSRSMGSFFLLGVCNGILPCGIVYYFLLSAVASGSAMGGAVVMGIFGVASALVMFAFALFASSLMRVLKPAFFNTLAGLCMVGYGGYGVFSNLALL